MSEQKIMRDNPNIFSKESMVHSFHLTLFSDSDEICELWLPKESEGHFLFSDKPEHRFLNIYAKNGEWIASCKKPAYFLDVPITASTDITLNDAQLLSISYDDRSYKLLVEKVVHERNIFHNYDIISNQKISIGNCPGDEIYYDGPFVSENHAVIFRENGQWSIESRNELYGIYVNRIKQVSCNLNLGDVIYIMGLKIIVGHNSLAINSGLGKITVAPHILQDSSLSIRGYSSYDEQNISETNEKYFNRAPRKRRESERKSIQIDGPPMSAIQRQMPLLLRLGGSMVMGGAAAMAGNFMTLITSVLFPFLNTKYTDKERKEYEALRFSKYTEYLEKKSREIDEAIKIEHRELNEKYPPISKVIEISSSKRLWERRPTDSDFLQLRIGTGSRPLSVDIEYPSRRFELDSDELEEKMYELAEKNYRVDNAPIVLPLIESYISGIQGKREQIIALTRSLVMQTAVHHSYDEVKMVFLLNQEDLSKMDSIRYLPHVWDDMRSMRLVATNEAEAYSVGEYIKGQISNISEHTKNTKKPVKGYPYYIIFALDKKLFDGHEVFKQFLQEDQNPGASVITAYDGLPKECQRIISLQEQDNNTCTTMGIDGGEDEIFSTDDLQLDQFNKTIHILANTNLKQINKAQSMPKMVTFLEMFNVGRIEQLNPLKRWRENNPVKSLSTPVGVGEDGSSFMLDLHEKRQGPHGLAAGMTGSGKSEFLITYILSMAVNYHPDEVSFVLIDYKGGGLADAFANPRTGIKLPHLAGTITNLDGASIQRSLMSIESELIRRQKVFSDISKDFDEGSMNIYTYQKLYRAGKVSEPMPHLFIISDEFAELKQQQPEFMEKLISAARIGRSLGVHLILATQKPSGVVNDQIRSNTKFRVCLRVQDRADSQDMLKRPDAAELTDTGRFYLQVGYNEYFAMGQSAWCGADYEPQDTVPIQRDDSIEFLDVTGQTTATTKPKVNKTNSGMKQIGAVVQYLYELANREGVNSRKLWQEELPATIHIEELEQTVSDNNFTVNTGLLDDPLYQTRIPMNIDFSQNGNLLIVGDSGSGKTTFIQNILYALSKQVSSEMFNYYILDYSSRQLKAFKKLPHCGAVLYEEDNNSLDAVFTLIKDIIEERKALFTGLGVDDWHSANTITKVPLIAVVIDNFAGFTASKKGDSIAYQLPACLKECFRYGVKFIITCLHNNEVSSKIRQTIDTFYCLSAKDKYVYSDILNVKVNYIPPELPGRGICLYDSRPLEFQFATYWADLSGRERISALNNGIAQLAKKYWGQPEARHLPVIDENVTYSEFAGQFGKGRIPLGFSKATGKQVALPLKQFSTLSIYFGNPEGKKIIIENLLYAAFREKMEIWVVRKNSESLFEEPEANFDKNLLTDADYISSSTQDVSLLNKALMGIMAQRKEIINTYLEKEGIASDREDANVLAFPNLYAQTKPIMVLIESFSDFIKALNPVLSFGYNTLFEKTNWRNIYVVACLDDGTDSEKEIYQNQVYSQFADNNVLLFGGQYHKQHLCTSLIDAGGTKILPYNVAVMQYNKILYPVVMPCGTIETKETDSDLESIF